MRILLSANDERCNTATSTFLGLWKEMVCGLLTKGSRRCSYNAGYLIATPEAIADESKVLLAASKTNSLHLGDGDYLFQKSFTAKRFDGGFQALILLLLFLNRFDQ